MSPDIEREMRSLVSDMAHAYRKCRGSLATWRWLGGSVIGTFDDPLRPPGTYTGPNRKLGDYYIRELRRIGTEHRQVVEFEIVGTGRTERMARSEFERKARAA